MFVPFATLQIQLSEHCDLLAALRQDETLFAEICADYELLFAEYVDLLSAKGVGGHPYLEDLEETLGALLDEISETLAKAARSPNPAKNDPKT